MFRQVSPRIVFLLRLHTSRSSFISDSRKHTQRKPCARTISRTYDVINQRKQSRPYVGIRGVNRGTVIYLRRYSGGRRTLLIYDPSSMQDCSHASESLVPRRREDRGELNDRENRKEDFQGSIRIHKKEKIANIFLTQVIKLLRNAKQYRFSTQHPRILLKEKRKLFL